MPEPFGTAKLVGEILPGVIRFTTYDERIEFQSDCYALVKQGKVVLIDPLAIRKKDLAGLSQMEANCLTASCHERSAWRLRRELEVPVYAPEGGVDFEEDPDRWYRPDDKLPGGLKAVLAPGPTEAHYAFYLNRHGGVLFCADLLTNAEGSCLAFVPDEYQDDPAQTRVTIRKLLNLEFQALCSNHGNPILHGAKAAIAHMLNQESQQRKARSG